MRRLTKVDVGEAVRFLDEGGDVAKSFTEALTAGGLIVEDVKKVAAAVNGVINSGLTRDALLVLVQARMKNGRNGKPFPKVVINDVIEALASIDHHLEKPAVRR